MSQNRSIVGPRVLQLGQYFKSFFDLPSHFFRYETETDRQTPNRRLCPDFLLLLKERTIALKKERNMTCARQNRRHFQVSDVGDMDSVLGIHRVIWCEVLTDVYIGLWCKVSLPCSWSNVSIRFTSYANL